jgi:hypothetical protein
MLGKLSPFFIRACLLACAAILSGCASLQPRDFAQSKTRFELDAYFIGHTRSWGVFENRDAAPRRYFVCNSYGKRERNGDVLLSQYFQFNDGKKQTRVWHIRRLDSIHWEATANDMVGVARGEGQGNAFFWEYRITLDPKNPLATVHIRQWMYQAEGTDILMTRLVISKFGITAFEVAETIHHVSDDKSAGQRQ